MSWTIFIPIFIVILCLLSIGLFLFLSMMNHIFFSYTTRQVIIVSLIVNGIYLLLFIGMMLLGEGVGNEINRILVYYLGILLYAAMGAIAFWIVYGGSKIFHMEHFVSNHLVGCGICLLIISVVGIAMYNYYKGIQVKSFDLVSSQIQNEYKFVQIGDIQFGSTSKQHLENTINLALAQDPDFIVFVGDLIDTDHYDLQDFEILSKLTVPLYFVSGNHEYIHDYAKLRTILDQYDDVKILDNQVVSYKEIQIIGIDHATPLTVLENISLDQQKYSILLYHEPKGIDLGVKKGFDLMLYGHTHGGQMFPLKLLTNAIYPHSKKFHTIKNTSIYTTDGAGLRGPRMRLGSQNEIVVFTLRPQ